MGIHAERTHSVFKFSDPGDAVFYEVALSIEESFLVTGNLKHFPLVEKVLLPSELLLLIRYHQR